jgi:hypothetical protein
MRCSIRGFSRSTGKHSFVLSPIMHPRSASLPTCNPTMPRVSEKSLLGLRRDELIYELLRAESTPQRMKTGAW